MSPQIKSLFLFFIDTSIVYVFATLMSTTNPRYMLIWVSVIITQFDIQLAVDLLFHVKILPMTDKKFWQSLWLHSIVQVYKRPKTQSWFIQNIPLFDSSARPQKKQSRQIWRLEWSPRREKRHPSAIASEWNHRPIARRSWASPRPVGSSTWVQRKLILKKTWQKWNSRVITF